MQARVKLREQQQQHLDDKGANQSRRSILQLRKPHIAVAAAVDTTSACARVSPHMRAH